MPDREIFDPKWWDKLQINLREAGRGSIGVHAFRAGHTCRYFVVPEGEFFEPDIFAHLHELSELAWRKPETGIVPCPTCGNDLVNWERRYQGRRFCGFCGGAI